MASQETTGAEPGVPSLPTMTYLKQSNAKCKSPGMKQGRAVGMHKWAAAMAKTRSSTRSTSRRAATGGGEPYPLPSWRIHGHRRSPAAQRRAPNQLDHTPRRTPPSLETRRRRRHTPPTPQRSPQPIFVPKTAPSRRLRRPGRRRCPTMLRISPGRQTRSG